MYPFKKFTLGELKEINKNKHSSSGIPIMYKYITLPFCEFLQKFVPKTFTPNMITLIGLFSVLLSFLITFFSDWKLENPPRILHLLNAILLFVYLTTDSLDGIHARKTNQCSVSGKILDHFVDSFAIIFSLIGISSTLKIGYNTIFPLLLVCFSTGFYTALISEKFTGSMHFASFSAVSEGLYAIIFTHLFHFFYPSTFKNYLKDTRFMSNIKLLVAVGTLFYLLLTIMGLFRDLNKSNLDMKGKKMVFCLIRMFLLIILFVPFFSKFKMDRYNTFSSLTIFSESFSICYFEEYLTSITKNRVDPRIFVFSYSAIALFFVNQFYWKNIHFCTFILLLSTIHVITRARSVIQNLSIKLK